MRGIGYGISYRPRLGYLRSPRAKRRRHCVGIAVENLAFLGGERAPALGSLLTLLRVSAGTRPSLGCLRPVFRRRATVPPSVKRRDRSASICSKRPSRATTGRSFPNRSAPTRSLH